MSSLRFTIPVLICSITLVLVSTGKTAANEYGRESGSPAKVYVPYKELKAVFEKEGQGVFLPYKEFQRLWRQLAK